ncbi:MAG: hypothetical protein ACPGVA_09850 [Pikeienuella sp.]
MTRWSKFKAFCLEHGSRIPRQGATVLRVLPLLGRPFSVAARRSSPLRMGLAGVAVLGAIASHANEPLDADQQSLFPGLESARSALGLPAELQGTGERTFKILEIQNISGNDPFNEQQPLLNFNGQVVGSVADLLALIQGQQNINVGGGNGDVCNPATQTSGVFTAFVNNFNFFEDIGDGSIDFDALTGVCQLLSDTNGDMLFFTYPAIDTAIDRTDLVGRRFIFDAIRLDGQLVSVGDAGNPNFFRLGRRNLRLRDPDTGRVFTFDIDIQRVAGRSDIIDVVDVLGTPRQVQAIVDTPIFTFTVFAITEG